MKNKAQSFHHPSTMAKVISLWPENTPGESTTLACPVTGGIILIPVAEISHCSASGNYTVITRMNGDELVISKTLAAVEGVLPAADFMRIHQSCLVRVKAIASMQRDAITTNNDISLPVSRARRAETRERILERSLTF